MQPPARNPKLMRIDYVLKSNWPTFSFEFLAPRTPAEMDRMFAAAHELRDLKPSFVCVTSRAGRHNETLAMVRRIKDETGIDAMAHLVCLGLDPNDVVPLLGQMRADGIGNVLALRGDNVAGVSQRDGSLEHASELIRLITENADVSVGAACYPEGHVESRNRAADLRYTRLKVELGASFLITQLFFDNNHYFKFVMDARAEGIEVPILPGIMPITNAKQLPRIKAMGATVPEALEREVLQRADDPEAVAQFGVAWASLQCTSLLAAGAPGVHFYTFNRSPATRAILGALRSAEPWKWAVKDQIA
jgi:methylenetetrahydrofolate reductase (NADPH)